MTLVPPPPNQKSTYLGNTIESITPPPFMHVLGRHEKCWIKLKFWHEWGMSGIRKLRLSLSLFIFWQPNYTLHTQPHSDLQIVCHLRLKIWLEATFFLYAGLKRNFRFEDEFLNLWVKKMLPMQCKEFKFSSDIMNFNKSIFWIFIA